MKKHRANRRRGTSAVEFAVVAPVALLFVFAAIEFGRAMFLQHVAVNTARAACRQGILGSATNATIQSTATEALQAVSVSGGTTSVVVGGESGRDTDSAEPGETIDVTVSIPYGPNSWVPLPRYLGQKALVGRVTMAKE
jgi:Flp pilus assembly protein TadG